MAYISFQPSDYFNIKLYTGNNSTQSITGVGFQPDMVWIKKRNATSNHCVMDAVRGATYVLKPNIDENSVDEDGLTSFDSDGFSLTNYSNTNSSNTFVSWNWKANGAGSANTDGSINTTSTSVNTTSGFSISKYTGTGANATVGHGLGVAPKMILFKDTTNASTNWSVYHKDIGNDYRLTLNDNSVRQGSSSTYYQSTDPTSSVFYIGSNSRANASSAVTIAYCFAEKKGFSKIGSYTGNGNADGAFVYTGFKPAMVIIKLYSTGAENWRMFDNKRIGYNPNNYKLYPSLNSDEGTSDLIDLYSNGFKPRTTSIESNGSGNGYIYMAFAESPIVSSNDIPVVAR